MEIIEFINDLRKMGAIYYKIWLPVILQFNKEEKVIIKLNSPIDIPKSTYYRVINYGISVFPKYVKLYTLSKNYSELILLKKEENYIEYVPKTNESIMPIQQVVTENTIEAEIIIEKPKNLRKKATETSYPNEVYEDIINFLNQATGKNYKTSSVINRKFITQRLNDGFSIEDFKQVISVKSTNWLGSKMEQFLRPETLFSNKFESYLNENIVSNAPNSNLKNTYDQVNLATEFFNSQG
jgi:uncharacterized phage protein (TIGR02220 family)